MQRCIFSSPDEQLKAGIEEADTVVLKPRDGRQIALEGNCEGGAGQAGGDVEERGCEGLDGGVITALGSPLDRDARIRDA